MHNRIYSVITGTGSYLPSRKVPNKSFMRHDFFLADGTRIEKESAAVIGQFETITGIKERRYVTDDLASSDIASLAARDALKSSGTDKETLDYIIAAHNFGDIKSGKEWSDFVPSMAARVKKNLGIRNPKTIAYDLTFGCPGWLQGVIQADYFIRSGDAKKILVIGSETLSRVSDPNDRDSMIYADGAGAVILESAVSKKPIGILSHAARTDSLEHAFLLHMDSSNDPDSRNRRIFLKMNGHKVYEYSLKHVPEVVKESLDKAGLTLKDVTKILIHQANEKMDEAILKRTYALYGKKEIPEGVMPMTISWLGNSSVATLPTLLDLILKGNLPNHTLKKNDIIVFASVGAGMNINALVYKR